MVMSPGRLLVPAPTRTTLGYGLLSVSQTPVDTDQHWQMGVRSEPTPCSPALITVEICPATGSPEAKTPTGTWETRAANPFTAYSMPVCAPVGNFDDYQAKVIDAFTAGEMRAVEFEFWTGTRGTLPHLAEDTAVTGVPFPGSVEIEQTAAVVITGTPIDVVEAIGLLEQALAECYGHEGVLHVPQIALAHLSSEAQLTRDGVRLRSPAGHLVAAGAGYPGTSPAGLSPSGGVWWFYATGAVAVRRGPIVVTTPLVQAVDKARNDVVLVAERTYVIQWDCCHFAVPVRLGGVIAGAVGGSS